MLLNSDVVFSIWISIDFIVTKIKIKMPKYRRWTDDEMKNAIDLVLSGGSVYRVRTLEREKNSSTFQALFKHFSFFFQALFDDHSFCSRPSSTFFYNAINMSSIKHSFTIITYLSISRFQYFKQHALLRYKE